MKHHYGGGNVPTFPPFDVVPQMIATQTAAYGERKFVVCGSQRLTYQEAEQRSAALADALIGLGVTRGTRVGALLPSGVNFVLCWLAVTRIGAVFVPFSTFVKPAELVWQLQSSDIHTLIVRDGFLSHRYADALAAEAPELLEADGRDLELTALPALRNVIVDAVIGEQPNWAQTFADVARGVDGQRNRRIGLERAVRPSDDAIIVYTSGTTAAPKGVIHTQGTMTRHPHNTNTRRKFTCAERIFIVLPIFWIGGFSPGLVAGYAAGACVVLEETFDAARALATIERERATVVLGWPFHTKTFEAHPDYLTRDISSLRTDVRNILTPPGAEVGLAAWPGWIGMTETFGPHLLAPMERVPPHLAGSFGSTVPGLEHRIADPATGAVLGAGEIGELEVRGYSVMRGYVGREREETFRPDGFFRTGDLGRFSVEGYFFMTGRLSDTIKTNGSNVAPAEVAAVLQRESGVAAAHVVGLPDPERGEIVAAALVPEPGAALDLDGVLAHAKRELSAFKIPRHLLVVSEDDIPMTATGKVSRVELRNLLTERVTESQPCTSE